MTGVLRVLGVPFPGTSSTASCPAGSAAGTPNAVCSRPSPISPRFNGVTDTEMRVWGFGLVQKFGCRRHRRVSRVSHFDADITCTAPDGPRACAGAAGGAAKKLPTEGIDV